jgi:hypothetical protein
LLTGTTLEWCDKNNKDQHDLHLLFSLSLVSSMSCSCVCGCVDGCVTIWRVNRKEKKSVSCIVVVAVFSQGKKCVSSHSLSLTLTYFSFYKCLVCVVCCVLHFEWVRLWDANNMLFFLIERKRVIEREEE